MTKEDRLYNMIVKGVELLDQKCSYSQACIARKVTSLGYPLKDSTLANIRSRRNKGRALLERAAEGIESVIFTELGMTYEVQSHSYEKTAKPDWRPEIVPEKVEPGEPDPLPFVFHAEGRPDVLQKAAFIKNARKRIIEFGIRLRTFSEYFISSNEMVYKYHLEQCLRRGVTIDCYVLAFSSPEANLYFSDRSKVLTKENSAQEGAKMALDNLRELAQEFAAGNYKGRFNLWQYRHIPYNHFLAVDPDQEDGKIQVAHYLYGIKRSDCPVLEIERAKNPQLFGKYWKSLQLLMLHATEIKK